VIGILRIPTWVKQSWRTALAASLLFIHLLRQEDSIKNTQVYKHLGLSIKKHIA